MLGRVRGHDAGLVRMLVVRGGGALTEGFWFSRQYDATGPRLTMTLSRDASAQDFVEAIRLFMLGCGYHQNSIRDAFEEQADELDLTSDEE